jgi:rare lipoprotein A
MSCDKRRCRPPAASLALLLAAAAVGCATTAPSSSTIREVPTGPRAEVKSVQEGKASWYGREQHGHLTANGERFDMYALTAAHRTLHMNTHVRVTNINNGRSCVVRINDRGPYSRGRIIDLSYAAAKLLGMLEAGVALVRVEVLGP